jgi:hypothetical protein
MEERAAILGISLASIKVPMKNLRTGKFEEIKVGCYRRDAHFNRIAEPFSNLGMNPLAEVRNHGINNEKGLLLVAESESGVEGVVFFEERDLDGLKKIFEDYPGEKPRKCLTIFRIEVQPENQTGAPDRKFRNIGSLLMAAVAQTKFRSYSAKENPVSGIVVAGADSMTRSIKDPNGFYRKIGMELLVPKYYYFSDARAREFFDKLSGKYDLDIAKDAGQKPEGLQWENVFQGSDRIAIRRAYHDVKSSAVETKIHPDPGVDEEDRIYAENNSERYMMGRAARNLEGQAVNMYIDLTGIPGGEQQMDENMGTLALSIAWQNKFGMNIRYILENDEKGRGLALLKAKLNDELSASVGAPYAAGDRIVLRNGREITVESGKLIDIRLENIGRVPKDREINDREYIIALKDDGSRAGIPIPNYTAAATMGLSLAALRFARDKIEGESGTRDEYERFRGKVLEKFRDIYRRYDVIKNADDLSEDELELMVAGSSGTKLYFTMLYALPPVIKVIEGIGRYHEIMRDALIAA